MSSISDTIQANDVSTTVLHSQQRIISAIFAYFGILAFFRNNISGSRKSTKRRKDYKNKEVSFSLMMSFILLDEHLRACSQDSSNKIKPLFTIKQTTGLSSVRIEFSRISVF